MTYYCPACESPTLKRAEIGYIDFDGEIGTIPGVACPICYYMDADESGPRSVIGRWDLGGADPFDFFIGRLRDLGCKPRPRE